MKNNSDFSKYHALLIGNSYPAGSDEKVKLKYSKRDVEELAKTITESPSTNGIFLKEDVAVKSDLSCNEMQIEFNDFLRKISNDSKVLFYFSGHGIIVLRGKENPQNQLYLCSNQVTNTNGKDALTVSYSLNLHFIINGLEMEEKVSSYLIILDCCRAGGWKYYKNEITKGTLIGSTTPIALAYESDSYNHSVFTYHLLQALKKKTGDKRKSYQTISDVFKTASVAIEKEPKQQIPNISRESNFLIAKNRDLEFFDRIKEKLRRIKFNPIPKEQLKKITDLRDFHDLNDVAYDEIIITLSELNPKSDAFFNIAIAETYLLKRKPNHTKILEVLKQGEEIDRHDLGIKNLQAKLEAEKESRQSFKKEHNIKTNKDLIKRLEKILDNYGEDFNTKINRVVTC